MKSTQAGPDAEKQIEEMKFNQSSYIRRVKAAQVAAQKVVDEVNEDERRKPPSD